MKFFSRKSIILFLSLFVSISVFSQKGGDDKLLETLGIVEDEKGEKVSDVLVVVTKDPTGTMVEKLTTNRKGNFNVALSLNKEFTITFSKPGYITKKITVNTKVINTKETYFQYPYTLVLSRNLGKNYGPEILGKPIVKVYYNPNKTEFDFDSLYFAAIKRELASLTADQKQKLIEKLEQKKDLANNPVKAKQLEKEFNDLVNQVSIENKFKTDKPVNTKPEPLAKPLTAAQNNLKKEQEEKDKKEKERIEKERIEKEKLEKQRKEKEENDKLIAAEIIRKKQLAKEMDEQYKNLIEKEKIKQKQKTADSLAKINLAKPPSVSPVATLKSNTPVEALSKEIVLIKKTGEELIGIESMMLMHNQYHISYLQKVKDKNDNYETKYNTKNPLTSLLDAMEEIDKDRKRALRQKKL